MQERQTENRITRYAKEHTEESVPVLEHIQGREKKVIKGKACLEEDNEREKEQNRQEGEKRWMWNCNSPGQINLARGASKHNR